MDIPPETEACYDAFMEAAEQTTCINPESITVHATHDPATSESEDDEDTAGPEKEESDSDSQTSTCWKRIRGKNTTPLSPKSTRPEEEMENKTDDQSHNNTVEAEA